MATMVNLIEKVLLNLEGYTGDTDVYGTLAANITNTASTFTVAGASYADGSGFSTGLVEIGTELVYVQNINRSVAPAQFSGVLRGFRGTTATAWTAGTRVRNNPRFPVTAVKDAINYTIKSLYPRLLAVSKTEFTGISSRVQYDMPNSALSVLSVQYLPSYSAKSWVNISNWSFDNFAGSNATGTKTINVVAPTTGRPIQVVYALEPSDLEFADEFTDSGLPSWMEELVIMGACWRLTSFVDSSRVSQITAEQSILNGNGDARSNSSGTSLAKFYLGVFEQQVQLAQQRQAKELPIQKHRLI
jgi:hypothetical protein